MIKSFSLLCRKPGMSHKDFVKHWTEVHAPMYRDVPGLRGSRGPWYYCKVLHVLPGEQVTRPLQSDCKLVRS